MRALGHAHNCTGGSDPEAYQGGGDSSDLATEVLLARRWAERAVEFDVLDPFVNFTMGRSFWLEGDLDGSGAWLDRSTSISPNYAQGIYARAWTHALSGRGMEGRADVDLAMALSPLDPLHYAMTATRALSHMMCSEDAEAARWAERAARSPGAHVLIAVIAIVAHSLNGDTERANAWAANVRDRRPDLTQADFFRAFPFLDPGFRQHGYPCHPGDDSGGRRSGNGRRTGRRRRVRSVDPTPSLGRRVVRRRCCPFC